MNTLGTQMQYIIIQWVCATTTQLYIIHHLLLALILADTIIWYYNRQQNLLRDSQLLFCNIFATSTGTTANDAWNSTEENEECDTANDNAGYITHGENCKGGKT